MPRSAPFSAFFLLCTLSLATALSATSPIVGYWAQDCERIEEPNGTIEIEDAAQAMITVAANQIYLITTVKPSGKSEYKLFYESADLAVMEMEIPLDDASKTKPVGRLISKGPDSLLFIWDGLRSTKDGSYIDLPFYSFEFDESGNRALLERCKH